MNNSRYPKVTQTSDGKVYVSFYIEHKRYRISNGKKFNLSLYPNSYPIEQRIAKAHVLADAVHNEITRGNLPSTKSKKHLLLTDLHYLEKALTFKLKQGFSSQHKKFLIRVYRLLVDQMKGNELNSKMIENILDHYSNPTSYNTVRRYLNNLINEAIKQGMNHDPKKHIKSKREKASLHKPIKNIVSLLNEIKGFNDNLFLCCLLTYGCLLRPHREIRELKWRDFSDELTLIKLSGHRNKSGRNRVVPIPLYVRECLKKGEDHHNIFTNTERAPNSDYFKTIWGRFKKVSMCLEQHQTIYSFRHSGALELYKRTGSIEKLRAAMGHSSILVSLTYLRGLEITTLKQCDMPMI